MMQELSKFLNQDILNDSEWKVEILKTKKGDIKKTKKFTRASGEDGTWQQSYKFKTDHVSLKDYIGSEDVPEEDRAKQHVLSPLLKPKKKVEPGWGSNSERYKRKRAWQMARVGDESKKEENYPRLFETPDVAKYPVEIDGKTSFKNIIWREGETYAFGIYRGKLFISAPGRTHGDIAVKQSKTGQNIGVYREKYLYPGRIWKSYKLISFWTYPDAKTFKKIIDELSERLNLNIMNDPEWKVEIIRIKNTGEIRKTKSFTRYNQEGTWLPIWKNEQKNKFEIAHIHPKDYVGSEDVPEEDRAKQHVLSPLLKPKKKVEPGWGSNSERYKRKRAWQMATVGDESKHEPYYPQLFENE
jgi:hypothetical protein